jgi:hypothetical protein
MKSQLNKLLLLILVILFYAGNGQAKQPTVSLSSGGSPIVKGYTPGTTTSFGSPKGNTLSANLNFGDVSAGESKLIQITLPVKLSASGRYKVELQKTPLLSNSIQPSDIGFSVQNVRSQINGSRKLHADAVNGIQIAGRFNIIQSSVLRGGKPQFQSSLADISETPTVILTGEFAGENSKFSENENSILVDLVFVMARQYYKPSDSFNLNLVLTITSLGSN